MMKHTIWTAACAAVVSFATAGILAQTTAQPPAPQQSAPSSSDKKITVTGCLKAAPSPGDSASAAATAGTSGTAATAGTTGTAAAGTTPAAGAGTTGTSGASTDAKFVLTGASASADAGTSAQTYRLIANPTALSEHVGKKLELTGTIDTTSAADPKDPLASAPALKVEAGKIVAASCSE
jgi:hypothetical protein